jgi:hypothetical protein
VTTCLIAFSQGPAVAADLGSTPVFSCCDLYGNSGGDWQDNHADLLGIDGNISEDPLFCYLDPDAAGNWTLQKSSPCLPAQSPCGQIGAWGEGCTSIDLQPASWGEMKTMYR